MAISFVPSAIKRPQRRLSFPYSGFSQSLRIPTVCGPSPIPIRFSMNIEIALATARIRSPTS